MRCLRPSSPRCFWNRKRTLCAQRERRNEAKPSAPTKASLPPPSLSPHRLHQLCLLQRLQRLLLPPLLRERAFRNHQSNRLHPKASTNPSVSSAVLTADSRTAEHSLRQWQGWTSTAMTMNGKTFHTNKRRRSEPAGALPKDNEPNVDDHDHGHEQQPWPAPVRFEVDPNAEIQPPAPQPPAPT